MRHIPLVKLKSTSFRRFPSENDREGIKQNENIIDVARRRRKKYTNYMLKRLVFALKTALSPFDTPKNLKNFRPAAGLYPKSPKILLRNKGGVLAKGGFLARNSTDIPDVFAPLPYMVYMY